VTEQLSARTLFSIFRRHASIWVLLPLIFSCILAAISLNLTSLAERFKRESVQVTAEVVGTTFSNKRNQDGVLSEVPTVTVRFPTEADTVVTSAQVSSKLHQSLVAGDQITILYLPGEPESIEVAENPNARDALITGGLSVIFLALWLLVVIRSMRFARNAIRVRDTGVRTLVEVTAHESPLMSSDQKPETRLAWIDSSGQKYRSLPIPEAEAKMFPLGRQIAIYELPGTQSVSVWEGDVGRPSQ
jgi:hypothetical protein